MIHCFTLALLACVSSLSATEHENDPSRPVETISTLNQTRPATHASPSLDQSHGIELPQAEPYSNPPSNSVVVEQAGDATQETCVDFFSLTEEAQILRTKVGLSLLFCGLTFIATGDISVLANGVVPWSFLVGDCVATAGSLGLTMNSLVPFLQGKLKGEESTALYKQSVRSLPASLAFLTGSCGLLASSIAKSGNLDLDPRTHHGVASFGLLCIAQAYLDFLGLPYIPVPFLWRCFLEKCFEAPTQEPSLMIPPILRASWIAGAFGTSLSMVGRAMMTNPSIELAGTCVDLPGVLLSLDCFFAGVYGWAPISSTIACLLSCDYCQPNSEKQKTISPHTED